MGKHLTTKDNLLDKFNENECKVSLGFKVISPVILTHVKVNKKLIAHLSHLTLLIKDAEEIFEEIIFSKDSCQNEDDFCTKELSNHLSIPRNFEGELLIKQFEFSSSINQFENVCFDKNKVYFSEVLHVIIFYFDIQYLQNFSSLFRFSVINKFLFSANLI